MKERQPSPTIRINRTTVDSIQPPETGEQTYKDSELNGFCIRVWSSGKKTYMVEGWVQGKGKSVRVTIGKHGKVTAEQARKDATKILGKLADGKNPNAEKRDELKAQKEKKVLEKTVDEVWLEYQRMKDLAPKTIKDGNGILKRCFSDWLNKPLSAITADAAAERYRDLSAYKGHRSNSDGAKAQADRAFRTLHSLFEYSTLRYGVPSVNPVKKAYQLVKRNKPVRRDRIVMDHQLEQWHRTVMSLETDVTRDLLMLLLFTGLRLGEAAALVWSEVDLVHAKTLTIPGSRTKNKRTLTLPLSDVVFDLLVRRFRDRNISCKFVFPGPGASGHVVEPKRAIANIVEKSGIQFSSHDLRRTFETNAEHVELTQYVRKRLLNHMDGDVTDGYTVITVEQLRTPMQKITDRLKEKMGITEEKSIEAAITHS